MSTRQLTAFLLLLVAACVTAACFFSALTQTVEHDETREQTNRLSHYDALLLSDLLKTRDKMLTSYDPLVLDGRMLGAAMEQLHWGVQGVGRVPSADLAKSVETLATLIAARGELIEDFKSQNAIFTNSLLYLPTLAAAIEESGGGAAEQSAAKLAGTILRDTLILTIAPDASLEASVRQQLAALKQAIAADDGDRAQHYLRFSAHVAKTLAAKHGMDKTVAAVLAIASEAAIDAVDRADSTMLEEEAVKAKGVRWVLIVLSLALIVLITYGSSRLRVAKIVSLELASLVSEKSKRLLESEQRFRDLIEQAADAIVVTDIGGAITDVNQQACSSLGYSREELLAKTVLDITTGLRPQDVNDVMISVRSGERRTFPAQHRARDGRSFPVEVRIGLINTGGEYRALAIARDISDRVKAESDRADAQMRLASKAKMAALGEMASGITHEINTPLASIGLRAAQISRLLQQDDPDKGKIAERMAVIEAMVKRIERIVTSMRAFVRNDGVDPFQAVAVATILEDIATLCHDRFADARVDLSLPVVPPEVTVECRPAEVCQVLINLLGNALDAIAGLPRRWVKVTVEEDGDGHLVLAVTDSGSGLSPEVFDQMCTPFFTTKPRGKGTGLGLSISRDIVERHGGRLTLDTVCANTRIRVHLPKMQTKVERTQAIA